MYFNSGNSRKWFRIVNPRTGETHILDLDEVTGSSKTKDRITISLKGSGTILIRGRGKWLEDAWKQFTAHTIGVPIYSYWARRKAK